ncbi:MAG: hypothetical protein R2778_10570 [Saprospiraceae bacterium]
MGAVYDGVVEENWLNMEPLLSSKAKPACCTFPEYDHRRIDLTDVLKVGDEICFKILDVDPKTGKMKLSRRAITAKPDGTMPTDMRRMQHGQTVAAAAAVTAVVVVETSLNGGSA